MLRLDTLVPVHYQGSSNKNYPMPKRKEELKKIIPVDVHDEPNRLPWGIAEEVCHCAVLHAEHKLTHIHSHRQLRGHGDRRRRVAHCICVRVYIFVSLNTRDCETSSIYIVLFIEKKMQQFQHLFRNFYTINNLH